ncbi:hypothetical protein [Sporocytophaga myxococcoides]|uniref:hypothetical protein n=1 Tax=Sporocytophaga myxococcoides TaxID=153721 RepID=UPI000406CA69|nr:hypothetical protein [Sporocytophaga myxococcoides]
MKRRKITIFLLIIFSLITTSGYLVGCNESKNPVYPGRKLQGKTPLSLDTTVITTPGIGYTKGDVYKFFFGEHYRKIWATPVEVPIIDLENTHGGLAFSKTGGNMQTISIRLKSAEGKRFVLRGIDKDPTKILPKILKIHPIKGLLQDQISAMNPYGPLAIPGLANAAGIFHTNPILVYVPDEKDTEEFLDGLRGKLAMLEEFPDEEWANTKLFGFASDIISTEDMLSERFKNQNAKIDPKAYAKCRLFDLLVGDWDRHSDQWKWAVFEDSTGKVFKPIPRDRDMVFFQFNDGLVLKLAVAINSKLQSYDYDIQSIKGMGKNSRYIDRLVLPELTETDWQLIIKNLQTYITDSVIENSIKTWPQPVFNQIGLSTIDKLKYRRDHLSKTGIEFYKMIQQEPIIAGTDKEDLFKIVRQKNTTEVTVYDNDEKNILFKKVFDNHLTNKITLYGLRGEDEFIIEGKANKGILINIYGGEAYDKILDHSELKGILKKTRVYEYGPNRYEGTTQIEVFGTDPLHYYFERSGRRE